MKAQSYVGGFHDQEIKRLDRLSESVESLTWTALDRAGIKDYKHILDVGCGPGNICIPLASYLRESHITGVDIGETFIKTAEIRAKEAAVHNLSFRIADVARLPFGDEQFDFIMVRFLLQHILDVNSVLSEIKRVAKPGAQILLIETDWGGQFLYPESEELSEIRKKVSSLLLSRGVDVHIGRKLASILSSNGFEIIDLYAEMQVFQGENITKLKDSLQARLRMAKVLFDDEESQNQKDLVQKVNTELQDLLQNPMLFGTSCRFVAIAKYE